MNKKLSLALLLVLMAFSLSGCSAIGQKSASISSIYTATTVLSLILLAGYCILLRKKDKWLLMLFSSVFVVNAGYMILSVSQTLELALHANRLSYLGSVFLPLSMFMSIMDTCRLKYKKALPPILLCISAIVFLIAATPGYLPIYYEEVSLSIVNGATTLNKVYGPCHPLYLVYLIGYLGASVAAIVYAASKKMLTSAMHAITLAGAVLVNIGVWLLEQLVQVDFELLSISYIISELFLLSLYLMLQEAERIATNNAAAASYNNQPLDDSIEIPSEETQEDAQNFAAKCEYFASQIRTLTPTERIVYDYYLAGKSTKEIREELNITENTLKYHNRNLYSKLGVSSRKQLVEIAAAIETKSTHVSA